MAEQKEAGKLALSLYPYSKDLGIGKEDQIALFTIPGQDFYSVALNVGEGEERQTFGGTANIISTENGKSVLISLDQKHYESGADLGAPVGSMSLFVQDRKEEGAGSFVSGSAYTAEQTEAMTALHKAGDVDGLKAARKEGTDMTANISFGHDLISAKRKVKAEAATTPTP